MKYFLLILLIPIVTAGVTHPPPLILNPGETGNINFVIDAFKSDSPLKCDIELETNTLQVSLDKLSTTIEPGKRDFILGNVTVPLNSKPGTYTETFCVDCNRVNILHGAVTRPRYCNIPIKVTVPDLEQPEDIEQQKSFSPPIILLSSIIISLIIAIILIIKKKSSQDFKTP